MIVERNKTGHVIELPGNPNIDCKHYNQSQNFLNWRKIIGVRRSVDWHVGSSQQGV